VAVVSGLAAPLTRLIPLVSASYDAVLAREVAARREAEAATRRVIDQSPEAYVSVDEQDGITEWNPAAEAVFGWSRDEVLGRDLGDLVLSPARSAAHRRRVTDFHATGTSSILGRHLASPMSTRDGRLIHLDCVVWSVTDDEGRRSLHTFMSDVTERRAAADDLRRATEDLSTFSAAMAHDLRGPLALIKGYAEMLDFSEDAARVGPELVARIDAAADRGVALIDDILRYLGVGRVRAVREPVDLTPLVERLADEHVLRADRQATIDVRPLPRVVGDERLLSQLFDNLLGNAAKYVPPDREVVEVVVDAAVEAPEAVVLRVSDNGVAVPEADRDRIFTMFARAPSTPRGASGSGVGLAVSRRIAELHDGDVTVEAGLGGGSRFCVRLPRSTSVP
jgi:PAS domain S-box-containing protein